jgi:hypothetical protein
MIRFLRDDDVNVPRSSIPDEKMTSSHHQATCRHQIGRRTDEGEDIISIGGRAGVRACGPDARRQYPQYPQYPVVSSSIRSIRSIQ